MGELLLNALQVVTTAILATVVSVSLLLRLRRKSKTVGIFHPYCDAGGGGERVLFCAVRYIPRDWKVVIFTGDKATSKEILERCLTRFGEGSCPYEPEQRERIRFVHLKSRILVEASTWPRLTLLFQSLGSVVVGLEAIIRCPTEVYLDSMGYAFTFPLTRLLAGSRVACYVHYPTISTDMLNSVIQQRPTYNNDSRIAQSSGVTKVKYWYYYIFSLLYGFVGGYFSQCTMVNSTWTKNHIDSLWKVNATLVYPPCLSGVPLTSLESITSARRSDLMLSLGQFRPEKDHKLQLSSLRRFKQLHPNHPLKLVMIGSCRGQEDHDRVVQLREFAVNTLELVEGIDFEFKVDAARDEINALFTQALIGLHTMWNEHFGISIVEMMASGLIVVAHDSGGPKFDIIKGGISGYLASDEESYAKAIESIIEANEEARVAMRHKARDGLLKYTEEEFGKTFASTLLPVLSSGRD